MESSSKMNNSMTLNQESIFPLEIFGIIIDHLVLSTPTFNLALAVQKVRLVSRAFNQEVIRSVCQSKVPDLVPSPAWNSMGNDLLAEYTAYRCFHDRREELDMNYWRRAILETTDYITKEINADSDARTDLIKQLCAIAAQRNSERESYDIFYIPGPFQSYDPYESDSDDSEAGDNEEYYPPVQRNALAAASALGMTDLVAKLLTTSGVIATETLFGEPLQCAARYGHEDVIKLFLTKEVPVDRDPEQDDTALIQRNKALLKELLFRSGGAEVLHRPLDPNCDSMLIAFLSLARHAGYYFPSTDELSGTLIPYLRTTSSLGLSKSHLEKLADDERDFLHRGSNTTQDLILIESCRAGDISGVQYALEKNANAKSAIRRYSNLTPLQLAVALNHAEIVRLLLTHIYPPESQNGQQGSGLLNHLLVAAKRGFIGVAKVLIEFGADVNRFQKRDDHFYSFKRTMLPLFEAMKRNQVDMVEYLVENGAKLHWNPWKDVEPTIGQMMYVYSSKQNFSSLVKYLVASKVEPYHPEETDGLFWDVPTEGGSNEWEECTDSEWEDASEEEADDDEDEEEEDDDDEEDDDEEEEDSDDDDEDSKQKKTDDEWESVSEDDSYVHSGDEAGESNGETSRPSRERQFTRMQQVD